MNENHYLNEVEKYRTAEYLLSAFGYYEHDISHYFYNMKYGIRYLEQLKDNINDKKIQSTFDDICDINNDFYYLYKEMHYLRYILDNRFIRQEPMAISIDDMNCMIMKFMKLLDIEIKRKELHFDIEIEDGIKKRYTKCDESIIEQILYYIVKNIVSNSHYGTNIYINISIIDKCFFNIKFINYGYKNVYISDENNTSWQEPSTLVTNSLIKLLNINTKSNIEKISNYNISALVFYNMDNYKNLLSEESVALINDECTRLKNENLYDIIVNKQALYSDKNNGDVRTIECNTFKNILEINIDIIL